MGNYVISIMVDAKDKNVKQVLSGVGKELQGLGYTAENTGSRMGAAFTGAGIAMAFGQAIPLIKNSIMAYNELRAGMMGLQSIVRFSGENWDQAKAAMQSYIGDGLVPMSQATTALKNLLLRGYGLEKSVELLGRFKDAAAYGRQGQLSMGQAIVSASEGLKNENSILVDNAGVTKNVSVMWKEYAATIGTTVGKLTKAQKLQAEYNGILAETAPMLGNAAGLTGELAGQMAMAEAKTRELKEAIGEAFAPAVSDALSRVTPFVNVIKEFAQANPMATMTLLGGSGLVAAVGALAAAFALMGPGGAIVVAVAAALVGLSTVIAGAVDRQRRLKEETRAAALETKAQVDSTKDLWEQFKELRDKAEPTNVELERLDAVQKALAATVPGFTAALLDQRDAFDQVGQAVERYSNRLGLNLEATINMLKVQRRMLLGQLAEINEDVGALESRFSTLSFEEYDELKWLRRDAAGLRAELQGLQNDLNLLLGVGVQKEEEGGTSKALKRQLVLVNDLTEGYHELKQAGYDLMSGQEIQLWEETGETIGDATEYLERFFERKETLEQESMDRFRASFGGHLKAMGGEMANWQSAATDMVGDFADAWADTLAAVVTGNKEAMDQLKKFWEGFFSWLIGEIVKILVKWFIGTVLNSILPGLGAAATIGADVVGDSSGSWTQTGQRGGEVRGGIRGMDSVFAKLQAGELVTSTPLTQGLARMVRAFESGVLGAGQGAAQQLALAQAGGGYLPPVTVITPDAQGFRRMLRSGSLGREWRLAHEHGRLPNR